MVTSGESKANGLGQKSSLACGHTRERSVKVGDDASFFFAAVHFPGFASRTNFPNRCKVFPSAGRRAKQAGEGNATAPNDPAGNIGLS